VVFAVAAKKCLVAFRPENVVFRRVALFIWFGIERNYGSKSCRFDACRVLKVNLLVCLACRFWSCCLYLVMRSVWKQPQALVSHVPTQPPIGKPYPHQTIEYV
jgi:hypothetical protein